MRSFTAAALFACALGAAAQPADPKRDADLQAARGFADLLERVGEPTVAGALPILVDSALSPDRALARDYPVLGSSLFGWVLPADGGVQQILCDDGLVRTFQRAGRLQKSRGSGQVILPPSLHTWSLSKISEWLTEGRRYRESCRGEKGACRLAHWAAWHARLSEDDLAVACWRAALDVLGAMPFPLDFPNATPSDRLAFAVIRALEAQDLRKPEEALRIYERIEKFSHESFEKGVEAEIAAILRKLETRHQECVAALAATRAWEAARTAWIGDWPRVDPSKLDRREQGEYWIRQLLAWHSEELEADTPGIFAEAPGGSGGSAFIELVGLGDDALPALVASACEPWPTRTAPNGVAITIGDACAFLIERIAGDSPFEHAADDLWPGRGLASEKRRELLSAWWSELEPLTVEQRWVALWKRGSRPAVDALIRLDARKHLPALVEKAGREPGRKRELERRRIALALRELPETQLRELDADAPEACRDLVREALSK